MHAHTHAHTNKYKNIKKLLSYQSLPVAPSNNFEQARKFTGKVCDLPFGDADRGPFHLTSASKAVEAVKG